jgi:hypothetical protein
MSKTKAKRKPGRNKGKRYAKPISLYPLTITNAILAIAPNRNGANQSDSDRRASGQ